MELKFDECNGAGTSLFEDFVQYKRVDKYVETVIKVFNNELDMSDDAAPSFLPLNLRLTNAISKKEFWVIQGGCVNDKEASEALSWLRRQPAASKEFMQDTIYIEGDYFERELYISL